jgi:hypothetical protein
VDIKETAITGTAFDAGAGVTAGVVTEAVSTDVARCQQAVVRALCRCQDTKLKISASARRRRLATVGGSSVAPRNEGLGRHQPTPQASEGKRSKRRMIDYKPPRTART